ncbi:MAG: hypothetical protein J7L50_00905 [Candidatus Odinarchaeota archaeon]|nr:hypothetical protein [Candidatus Odinarchaeota archaeon]
MEFLLSLIILIAFLSFSCYLHILRVKLKNLKGDISKNHNKEIREGLPYSFEWILKWENESSYLEKFVKTSSNRRPYLIVVFSLLISVMTFSLYMWVLTPLLKIGYVFLMVFLSFCLFFIKGDVFEAISYVSSLTKDPSLLDQRDVEYIDMFLSVLKRGMVYYFTIGILTSFFTLYFKEILYRFLMGT